MKDLVPWMALALMSLPVVVELVYLYSQNIERFIRKVKGKGGLCE